MRVINSDHCTQADFYESEKPDLFEKTERFSAFLTDWRQKGTYAYHREACMPCANHSTYYDPNLRLKKDVIVMASNNYLGLNTRPELIASATNALIHYGTGLCGSRFLSGTSDMVSILEHKLAEFEQREDAMVFTTGYQANVGTLSALLRPGDTAIIDRLCHASIVDGCRLAGCTCRAFRHNDADSLKRILEHHSKNNDGGLFLVVDGVFSMDGDMAPLNELIPLAKEFGARVMVDEAHGTGVLGPNGRGATEYYDVEDDVDIILGTFSKTLAATGGFIVASHAVVDYVRHYARSYIFTASPTPATVATASTALDLMQREPELRNRLWENINYFHKELKLLNHEIHPDTPQSAIITLTVGADMTVRDLGRRLFEHGLLVGTAAYPAVPKNQGRLRFCISAGHTRKDLDEALDIMARVLQKHAAQI